MADEHTPIIEPYTKSLHFDMTTSHVSTHLPAIHRVSKHPFQHIRCNEAYSVSDATFHVVHISYLDHVHFKLHKSPNIKNLEILSLENGLPTTFMTHGQSIVLEMYHLGNSRQ